MTHVTEVTTAQECTQNVESLAPVCCGLSEKGEEGGGMGGGVGMFVAQIRHGTVQRSWPKIAFVLHLINRKHQIRTLFLR